MVPVLIEIGPVSLFSFGATLALGFLVAGVVLAGELEARGLSRELASGLIWWGAIGGLLGSRLLSLANDWSALLADPLGQIFGGAGFVWYGGFLGGLLTVSLFIRQRQVPWAVVTDAIAPALVLGHAIGRVGCQLSGDGDWGPPSTLPWAMAYPLAIVGWSYAPGVRVHPAPVYESLAYGLIYLALIRIARDPQRRPAGFVMASYLVLSGLARFVIEGVRIEPRVLWGLTEAQTIAVACMVAGGVWLALLGARNRPLAAAAGLLGALLGSAGCNVGAPLAPDFVAQDLDGAAVRLSNYRGSVVLLNLWTTWCPPCREEMPSMQELSGQLGARGLVVLAVSEDNGGAAAVRPFAQEFKLDFKLLVDSTGTVGRLYGISGYPETFVIDREGRQLARFIGPRDWTSPELVAALTTLVESGRWPLGPDGN